MSKTKMMTDALNKIGFEVLFPLYNMGMNEEQIIELLGDMAEML